MARGTQHRKRRPAANAAVAPSRSPKAKTKRVKHGQLGGPALLRAAAPPRQVGVRPPRDRLRVQLRPLRRRLGLDRASATPSSNFFNTLREQRRRRSRSLEKKTRENPKDAEAWRELATAPSRTRTSEEAIAALDALHRSSSRRTRTRSRSSAGSTSGARTTSRSSTSTAQTKATLAPARRHVQAGAGLAARAGARRTRSRPGSRPRRATITNEAYSKYIETQGEGGRRLQAARGAEPEGRHEPVPAGAGRAGCGQQRRGDRGVHGVPQAGAERLARTGCEEGAEGAEGATAPTASASTAG